MAVLRTAIGLPDAKLNARVLVVAQAEDEVTWKSLRNAPGVRLLATGQLNTYDVLASEHIVFTEAALSAFTGQPVAEAPAPAKASTTKASTAKASSAKASKPATGSADATESSDGEAPKAPRRRTPPKEAEEQ
jgi:large subunit ribosomal protein L4